MKNTMRNFPLKYVRVIRKGSKEAILTEISEIKDGDTGFLHGSAVIFGIDADTYGNTDLAALDRDMNLPCHELGYRGPKRSLGEDIVDAETYNGLCRFAMEFLAPDLPRAQVSQETQVQMLRCGAVLRESGLYTGCQVLTQVLVPWDMTTEELWYAMKTARALYCNMLGVERLLDGVQKLGSTEDPMDYLMDAYDQEFMLRAQAQKKVDEFLSELKALIPQLVDDVAAKIFPKK